MYSQNNVQSQLNNLRVLLRQLNYTYQQKAYADASNLLNMIQSLKPFMQPMRYQNGQQENLLCLSGTIPMYYRTRRYNIPVKIYLTRQHPIQAPLCYVSPTQDMIIKPKHNHVAQKDGRCYLPYLSQWNYQSSNLYDLVNVMSTIFGQDPPVFKKPANYTGPTGNTIPTTTYNPGPSTGMAYSNTETITAKSNFNKTNYSNPSYFNQGGMTGMPGGGVGMQSNVSTNVGDPLKAKKDELTKKVREKLQRFVQEQTKKLDNTMKDQRELESRTRQQKSTKSKMIDDNRKMDEKIVQMEKFIEKSLKNIENHSTKEPDYDNVIKIQDVLSKQYIECNAEQISIEDILYYLDRAVIKDVITLDQWLKEVRKLTEKQFYKKALLNKINQKRRF